ncbi:alpha/beta hydrolase [Paractinoplanes maris]|uniref:alpha/beta hydrolase n=1 Tax=Paractinoplanes maris TaxID=1734446 RepID=UPI002020EA1C|nr:alpha/beta hydrolase [Actinoplanes maris]
MTGRPVVLDPIVERLVEASSGPPFLHELGPRDGRQALLESQGPAGEDPAVRAEFRVAPVGPSGLVGFWLFTPAPAENPPAVAIYAHGGRWMMGDAHTHRRLIADLVVASGLALVVPEYTRTPEARFPIAVEEIYALTVWITENSAGLGLDAGRLAVAGDCAGATLAASLTLLAKRRGGPRISAQLLYYPLLDARCEQPSHREFGSGYLLTHDAVRWYWEQYSAGAGNRADPVLSPMSASIDDLTGLPPALIISAEADPVRDEAEVYASRLRAAGVAAFAVRYLGVVHDFVSLTALRSVPASQAAIRQGADFLREALA